MLEDEICIDDDGEKDEQVEPDPLGPVQHPLDWWNQVRNAPNCKDNDYRPPSESFSSDLVYIGEGTGQKATCEERHAQIRKICECLTEWVKDGGSDSEDKQSKRDGEDIEVDNAEDLSDAWGDEKGEKEFAAEHGHLACEYGEW